MPGFRAFAARRFVDDHVHGLPRAEVVQRHVVLVRRFTRHVLDPAGVLASPAPRRRTRRARRWRRAATVADLALVDVVRVDIADDLEAGMSAHPIPRPGCRRRVVHRVRSLLRVVHAVGVRVGGAADVDLREGFVPAHDPRLPPVVILLGLEALPAPCACRACGSVGPRANPSCSSGTGRRASGFALNSVIPSEIKPSTAFVSPDFWYE